jgi:flagellar biosynthesis protein FlhA
VIPLVRVHQDTRLEDDQYVIAIHGSRVAQGEMLPGRYLAINPGGNRPTLEGRATREPTYELPAQWIDAEQRQFARGAGYTLVDAETVLLTHLAETLRRHAAEVLTRSETERLVGRVRQQQPSLLEELVPNILTYSDIQKVLQALLRERVSIRNMEAILEVLVDQGKQLKSPEELTEKVRERLGHFICQALTSSEGEMHVLTLDPELEQQFLSAAREQDGHSILVRDPLELDRLMTALARQAEAMMQKSLLPVLLCPGPLRRHVRRLIDRSMPYLAVLGLNEVPQVAKVRSFGVVSLN